MKKSIQQKIAFLTLGLLFSVTLLGQSASDENINLNYDPHTIALEWNAWHESPTAQNAFVGQFMSDFNVPQESVNKDLSLLFTWQWWASHHPAEVQEYITRRDEAAQE